MKTKIHFDSGAWLSTEKIPLTGHITPHISWDEYANKSSSAEYQCEVWPESLRHAKIAEEVRNRWVAYKGIPEKTGVVISSMFRTEEFNARPEVGGDPKSLHLHGCATDFLFGSLSDSDWQWLVKLANSLADKYATQIELGRYDWGAHIGSHIEVWNPYTSLKVYLFDRRTKK